ncbi:hypothetical protein D1614_02770 [Maribellus luteus]|uniref:Uncharacterized protein n=1 Tax=Maribellus luteus TaxID=2305463 RepID=A0A399T9K6_9BACT|nr:hypothetical protein D1614_02770 [Maribellus luteus]
MKQQMEDCIVRNNSFSSDYFSVAMTEYNNRIPHTTDLSSILEQGNLIGFNHLIFYCGLFRKKAISN